MWVKTNIQSHITIKIRDKLTQYVFIPKKGITQCFSGIRHFAKFLKFPNMSSVSLWLICHHLKLLTRRFLQRKTSQSQTPFKEVLLS